MLCQCHCNMRFWLWQYYFYLFFINSTRLRQIFGEFSNFLPTAAIKNTSTMTNSRCAFMYCLVKSFFWWYNKFDELWYWWGCIYVFWQVFGFVKARFPTESRRVWCRWIFQKFLFKRILYKKRFLSDSWPLSNCSAVLCLIRRARRGDKNWILTATALFSLMTLTAAISDRGW